MSELSELLLSPSRSTPPREPSADALFTNDNCDIPDNDQDCDKPSDDQVALRCSTSVSTSNGLSSPSPSFYTPIPSQYRPSLKRKLSEDLATFAEEQAYLYGLSEGDAREVASQFTQYNIDQKLIVLMCAHKKQVIECKRAIEAASGPWAPSSTLVEKIVKYSYVVLVDPALPCYIQDDVPIKLVLNILKKFPGWGYTAAVANDQTKKMVVEGLIRGKLTDLRAEFKQCIAKFTTGTDEPVRDINSLCRKIINSKSKIAPTVKLSLQMAARFAFLRHAYVTGMSSGNAGRFFWQAVDKGLKFIRTSKDENAHRISKVFERVLETDRTKYPPPSNEKEVLPDLPFIAEEHCEDFEISAGRPGL